MKQVSKTKIEIIRKLFFLISLLINVVFTLQIFANISGWNLEYFFNSDGLYLASIYKDLFVENHSLEGWHLNAAPNFIPEWPVYFILRAIAGDFRLAALLYAVFSILTINLLTAGILKAAFDKINYSYLALANFGYSMFLLFYLTVGDFINTAYLFQTGYHLGVFIMLLISLLFYIRYFKYGSWSLLTALFISVALGVVSDRLLLTFFVAPAFLSLFFINRKPIRKKILVSFSAIVLAAVSGILLYITVKNSEYLYIIILGNKFSNFTNILPSFKSFYDVMAVFFNSGSFKTLVVLFSIISLTTGIFLTAGYLYFKSKMPALPLRGQLLVAFMSAAVVTILITPILNGYFYNLSQLRFNIYGLHVAISLFAALVFIYTHNVKAARVLIDISVATLVVLSLVSIVRHELKVSTVKQLSGFVNYYPDEVRTIDKLAKENNLKYGVGNYWHAKKTSMFSKQNVRVFAVYLKMDPWFHVTNEHWYYGYEDTPENKPVFNFILMNNYKPTGAFFEKLTINADTIEEDNVRILKVPEFGYRDKKKPYVINME